MAIVTYIECVDLVKLDVGEETTSKIRGKVEKLVVTGYKRFKNDDSAKILAPASDIKFAEQVDKIKSPFASMSIEEIINVSKENITLSDNIAEDAINKIGLLNSGKCAIYPFKPGMKCSVIEQETDSSGKVKSGKKKNGEIYSIRWNINKCTGILECKIAFRCGKQEEYDEYKSTVWLSSDYCEKFSTRKEGVQDGTIKKDSIKMNVDSIILPVEVVDKTTGEVIAIDCRYMYKRTKDKELEIIAEWNSSGGLKSFGKIDSGKIIEYLNNEIKAISFNRRFIAPYMMVEPNRKEV